MGEHMEEPVVVISHTAGGAAAGGTTIGYNPAHIVRAVVRKADGSYQVTLHDVSGQSFQLALGPDGLTKKQIEEAVGQLFKLATIEYSQVLPPA